MNKENLYNYLNQSLSLLEKVDNNKINSEIAYIYIDSDNNVFVSNNLSSVININSIDKLLDNINDIKGKFVYKNKIYYYATESNNNIKKIAITGSSYINFMRAEILKIILIVVGITFVIISLLVLIWSNHLVNRIKKLMLDKNFCKLILIDNNELIGFISIFPNDCEEEKDLSPWYATMYVKEKYRGRGYSKMLNDAIIKEAFNRGFEKLYLKTDLENYYEKFGAQYIKKLSSGEKLYYIKIK